MSGQIGFRFVDPAAQQGDAEARELLWPKRGSPDAAGLDLVAANPEPLELAPGKRALVPTGVSLALPSGLEGQIRPRSGLALRHGVTVLNSPGTIDADYRGEIKVLLINHGGESFEICRGMRVAQLIITPVEMCSLEAWDHLPETARGVSGFGSTGISS